MPPGSGWEWVNVMILGWINQSAQPQESEDALSLPQNCCQAVGSEAEMESICKAVSTLSRNTCLVYRLPPCTCPFLGWRDSGLLLVASMQMGQAGPLRKASLVGSLPWQGW